MGELAGQQIGHTLLEAVADSLAGGNVWLAATSGTSKMLRTACTVPFSDIGAASNPYSSPTLRENSLASKLETRSLTLSLTAWLAATSGTSKSSEQLALSDSQI